MADALALPPAAPPARPRVLLVGTVLATGATFMAFAGIIGLYLAQRGEVLAAGGTWLPDGTSLPLTPGGISMVTMLLSGVTIWWAVDAVGKNDRPMAYLALGLTIMFGFAVINATTFLYTEMGLAVDTRVGLLIYAITGAHLAMVIAGMVYAAVMTFRTLGGVYRGRDREGLVSAAVFWYGVIAVNAVIWYAIYVTK